MLVEVARLLQDPAVGAVQCRVRIHNRDKILGAVQDLEFGSIVNASQILRNSTGSVGLGGNGQFTRLSALTALGAKAVVQVPRRGHGARPADAPRRGGRAVRLPGRGHPAGRGGRPPAGPPAHPVGAGQPAVLGVRAAPDRLATDLQPGDAGDDLLPALAVAQRAGARCSSTGLFGAAAYNLLPGHAPTRGPVPGRAGGGRAAVGRRHARPGIVWAFAHRSQLRDERLSRLLLAAVVFPAFLFLGLLATVRAIGRQLTGKQGWAKTERLVEEPCYPPCDPPASLAWTSPATDGPTSRSIHAAARPARRGSTETRHQPCYPKSTSSAAPDRRP
jgi:hypothetical protein